MRRRRTVPAVVLSGALLVTVTGAPVRAAEPAAWWCAPDAHLSAATLPAVLPLSACSLSGRLVHSAHGLTVGVPDVGYGVALGARLTDGSDDLSVWTDEYAVHLGGGEYTAALGYLDAIRSHAATGSGDPGELSRMALAVRRVATRSTGRVRPPVVPTSTVFAAADDLVDGLSGAAATTLDGYLRLVVERDDSPDLAELRRLADDGRATLASRTMDVPAAERLLTDTVLLVDYAASEQSGSAGTASVGTAIPVLDDLVTALRGAIGDVYVPADFWAEVDPYETALADVSDYLAGQLEPYAPPVSVPVPVLPSIGDETGGLLSAGSPHPCSDGARAPLFPDRSHWTRGKTIDWYYNHSFNSGDYTVDGYLKPIAEGFDNMTKLHDDCGYTWRPKIANRYVGQATRTLPQPPDRYGNCQEYTDGKNIVGWDNLPAGKVLAWACAYRRVAGVVNGFDVTIANNVRWNIPEFDFCDRYAPDWDLEAVMTHEYGHALALGHVSEAKHGKLTMSEVNNGPCTRGERTPGYGDAVGLAVLYGRA